MEEARRNCHTEGPRVTTPTSRLRAEGSASDTLRGENVGDIQRLAKDRKVRSEFEDVFNVKTDCGSAVSVMGGVWMT